jgi:hypothetical protein
LVLGRGLLLTGYLSANPREPTAMAAVHRAGFVRVAEIAAAVELVFTGVAVVSRIWLFAMAAKHGAVVAIATPDGAVTVGIYIVIARGSVVRAEFPLPLMHHLRVV